MEHAGGVVLAGIQFRVHARVRLSKTDDDVLAAERRWKTGRMRGGSTVSARVHTNHACAVNVLRPTRHKTGHFGDVLSQTISWPITEDIKLETTKADDIRTKQKKSYTKLNVNLNQQSTTRNASVCVHIIVHNCSTLCIMFCLKDLDF